MFTIIFACIFACINFFLRPFVLLKMYSYFIPVYFIGAPIISFWGMFGISLFLALLINGYNQKDIDVAERKLTWKDAFRNQSIITLSYLICWGVAYLASLGV